MSNWNLRKKSRISYCETEEPSFDSYVYCDKCADFVYEYCSIHGPLLVIPDEKVPADTGLPAFVPRAALTIPRVFLHIAPSVIPGAGLGVFSSMSLPSGIRFGPYCGLQETEVQSNYCWQIFDNNNKPSHVIDAIDPNKSNWMRYVNCARHYSEQNLVAYQYQGQLYYRTMKFIHRFTELLVFYGGEFASSLRINLKMYNNEKEIDKLEYAVLSSKCFNLEKPQNEASNEFSFNEEITNDIDMQEEDYIDISFDKSVIAIDSSIDSDSESHCFEIQDSQMTYSSETNYTNVIKEGIMYSCVHCTLKKIDKRAVYKHVRSTHKEKCFDCNICGKSYVSEVDFNAHTRIHSVKNVNVDVTQGSVVMNGQDFFCAYCSFTRRNKIHVHRHVKSCHKDKCYHCQICSKMYVSEIDYNTHLRAHNNTRQCKFCPFETDRPSNLIRHEKIHTSEKKYSCTICRFSTRHERNLRPHMKTHDKKLKCFKCDYECFSKEQLVLHCRTHSDVQIFECAECEYIGFKADNLRRHFMKVHKAK